MSASGPITWFTPGPVPRGGFSIADVLRRAHARIAERFDPAKVRHKPLSILRQEARRALDQFFEVEWPHLPRAERAGTIEDILNEAIGFGPLEELFREEAVREIMVLAPAQVIVRRGGDAWLPTSVRFRDAAHLRAFVARAVETGESLLPPAPHSGAVCVRLANGFRAVGVLPPAVMDAPPTVAFVRGEMGVLTPAPLGSGAVPAASTVRTPPVSGSGVVSASGTVRVPAAAPPPAPLPVPDPPQSELMPALPDRLTRLKQKVTERLIAKCAALGMYDLSAVGSPVLQQIVQALLEEMNPGNRMGLGGTVQQRLVLEILAGMNR